MTGGTRQRGGRLGAGAWRRLGLAAAASALLGAPASHAADDLAPARAAIAQQDFPAAVALLQDGHHRSSSAAEASYLLGLALHGTGQTEAALAAFERTLEQRPRHVDALLEAGLLYLERGRFAEAEAAFHRGLEQNPKRPSAFYYGLGKVKMETDSLRSARVWLTRGTAEEDGNPTYHQALGDLYARLGTAELALSEYRKALDQGIASPAVVHHAIGKVHSRQRQFAEAMAAWQLTLAADSTLMAACSDLASLYLTLDPPSRYDQAVPLLQRLVRLQPDNPALASRLARVMAQAPGYSGGALPLLESAAERDPGDIRLQVLIGKLSWRKADHARAAQAYRQAAQIDPEYPGVLDGLAEAEKASGDTVAAIATMQQIARLDTSGREDVAGALGVLLFEQERYAEAIPNLEQKLLASPDKPLLYRLLGLSYIRERDFAAVMGKLKPALDAAVTTYPNAPAFGAVYGVLANELYGAGRYGDAIALFEEKLKRDPENGGVYLNIGYAHYVQKDYARALSAFSKAARYQPDNAQAHLYQGLCYRLTGDDERAKAPLLKAAKLDPKNPEALRLAGLSLLLEAQALQQAAQHEESQREAVQAVSYLQRAVESRGNDVQAHLWLAQGYALSRQLDKAREEFTRVLKMDPDNADARSGLDRVQG